jgi:putative salt-induced outer membrane protein YdiY
MKHLRKTLPLTLGLVVALAHAQATVKPDGQWRSSFGLGASNASGNTRASSLTLVGDAVKATAGDRLSGYGRALYARSAGVTTGEELGLGGRYDYDLSSALFGYGGIDLLRNKLGNLSLRSQLSAGLGWHVIKSPTTTFDLFGGVAYSNDKFINATRIDGALRSSYAYTSLMLGEESTHKLSDTTSFKQRFVMLPNLKNSGEYRASWDAGLAVAMSKAVNLNAGFSWRYDSQPGTGLKSTDTLLTTGVSMKFD